MILDRIDPLAIVLYAVLMTFIHDELKNSCHHCGGLLSMQVNGEKRETQQLHYNIQIIIVDRIILFYSFLQVYKAALPCVYEISAAFSSFSPLTCIE